jgi:hypothetical protein
MLIRRRSSDPSPLGLPSGYTFQQIQPTTISVKIPLPSSVRPDDVEFAYNPDENSIYLTAQSADPILCGILFAQVSDVSHRLQGDIVELRAVKSAPRLWPRLIASPSPRGIDPKSQYLLGQDADARGQVETAWIDFSAAAAAGFPPARLFVADVYTTPDNPYKVTPDLEKAAGLYADLFAEFRTADVGLRSAETLQKLGRFAEAQTVLDGMASPEAILALAVILSSLASPPNDVKNDEKAVRLFSQLMVQNDPSGMRWLARHLEEGVGIAQNGKRARELAERADRADGKFRKPVVVAGEPGPVVVAAAAAVGVLVLGLAVYVWRRRK